MLIFGTIEPTLLFGLAANTDNLTVGIAYGMKRSSIRGAQNLLIAVVTTLVTLLALVAGQQIRTVLPTDLPGTIGGVLLIRSPPGAFITNRRERWPGQAGPSPEPRGAAP
jgi:hypothetical protein